MAFAAKIKVTNLNFLWIWVHGFEWNIKSIFNYQRIPSPITHIKSFICNQTIIVLFEAFHVTVLFWDRERYFLKKEFIAMRGGSKSAKRLKKKKKKESYN